MTEVQEAVHRARDVLGERIGSESELLQWIGTQDCDLCHFCGEHMSGIHVDFQDDFKGRTTPTSLCCRACWDLRRAMPYHLVKEHCVSLKSGAKKFCGGEWHESLDQRVLYKSQFDAGFDVCRECMHENVKKRRIPFEDYVRSWTDESSWQNRMSSILPRPRSRKVQTSL
jgi:hypothetical protein